MRNMIDFDMERDAVALVCAMACDTEESCINFITSASTVAVHLTVNPSGGGTTTTETVQTVNGAACYTIPDATMRAAGEFTVSADNKTAIRFVVESSISAGKALMLYLKNGVFYVRAASDGTGQGNSGPMWCMQVNEEGNLMLHYDDGSEAPNMAINDDGDLIYTIEG